MRLWVLALLLRLLYERDSLIGSAKVIFQNRAVYRQAATFPLRLLRHSVIMCLF